MTIYYTKLKGMEVLAEQEGALLGSVRWVVIDSKRKQAKALVFKGRGVAGEKWAKVTDVKRIGRDVVFLSALAAVRDGPPRGRDVRDMLGLPVTSLDGKRLGILDDLVFADDTWKVASVVIEGGAEVDLAGEAVLGEDTLLLQKGAQEQLRRKKTTGGKGFLDRVFSSERPAAKKKKTARKSSKRKSTRRKS